MRDQNLTKMSSARGRPGGRQMPDPRAVIKFQMPHPRDWNMSKCPANARGGMGTAGIDWCVMLQL